MGELYEICKEHENPSNGNKKEMKLIFRTIKHLHCDNIFKTFKHISLQIVIVIKNAKMWNDRMQKIIYNLLL